MKRGYASPAVLTVVAALAATAPAAAQGSFSDCLNGLEQQARARGVLPQVFQQATSGLTPDNSILSLLDRQPEFSRQPWDYINGLVAANRIAEGRRMLQTHRAAFDRAERETGVDRHVIAAIWGIETSFGRTKGNTSVVRATATLACYGRRQDFFRGEFVAALQIIHEGHVSPANFRGSWAGAFGHTQFMPSTFLRAARSGSGSQRIDLMGSVPDALMSTGNLLRAEGWQAGQGWGYEVVVPQGLDLALAGRERPQTIAQWEARGVRRVGDRAFPRKSDQAFLHLPGGARGPAFLMLPNFRVIMKYNNSENYAMAVGHLADRLRGGGGFAQPWPTAERALSQQERIELQQRLAQVGLYTGTVDGKLGAGTREALQRFQARAGMPADGFPTAAMLQRLRRGG
ncbi:MAG: lytic murein transglycosylase [Phreatobacter sp.]|uniref:lytic murein transglycosylase n=1 Tax=Phreatobacter sp. TaxID=1966341 RepID=UPI002735D0D5|nr:lytic murein transglycosylase [Phreatobacter sp.]MDP2803517.1 lytic murein transglycosylase [Phreatobacter sp.]